MAHSQEIVPSQFDLVADPDRPAYYYRLANGGHFTPAMLEDAHRAIGDIANNGQGFVDATFVYATPTEEAMAAAIFDHELDQQEISLLKSLGTTATGPLLVH